MPRPPRRSGQESRSAIVTYSATSRLRRFPYEAHYLVPLPTYHARLTAITADLAGFESTAPTLFAECREAAMLADVVPPAASFYYMPRPTALP